jgi:hypothetical protein
MKTPTAKEIAAEVATLKAMKPNVLKSSAFGDNHHNAIESQIEVMETGMEESEIYDNQENENWPENVVDSALEARRWLDGDEDYPPSEGWKPLVV